MKKLLILGLFLMSCGGPEEVSKVIPKGELHHARLIYTSPSGDKLYEGYTTNGYLITFVEDSHGQIKLLAQH